MLISFSSFLVTRLFRIFEMFFEHYDQPILFLSCSTWFFFLGKNV